MTNAVTVFWVHLEQSKEIPQKTTPKNNTTQQIGKGLKKFQGKPIILDNLPFKNS